MSIDFTLTAEQVSLRKTARDFAQNILKPIALEADAEPDPQKAFAMMKPAYIEAHKLGLTFGFIPTEYGGSGITNVDLQIVAEEVCAVDPGFGCILLVNGLALLPLLWYGSEEQKRKWLVEATSDQTGEYIAGFNVSETAGTANFDHAGAFPAGLQMTAEYDEANREYVLNGSKYWPSSSGGWDLKGANVNMFIVRTDKHKGGNEGLSAILVPRGTPGMTFKAPIDKIGHRTNQNNWIECDNCRVPEENAFAIGNGDLIVSKAFTWSGPVAGITAVGVARSAFEWTMEWAKTFTAAGDKPIINHQAVGYMLGDVAMRIEASRYLCWKAAHYLDMHDGEGQAFGAMAKIFSTELLFDSVYKCMQIAGVNSLSKEYPLEKLLREAAVLPIYDAGTVGMQRRKVWGVMADKDYDTNAFRNCEPVEFKKSMQGW
ncbi:acyl-CoA dehydrogenase family protein [Pontibaca salina]|uniref:Acyl-CoA dehydrogenase family protein n=1 Tax=Pontibaca salina TaxID=2795731 RepID=A0A934HQB7_9RHOB|nr:acyl-CoA dehydrogenase family protein [Pontibaca salina]MBI6629747.1 acyl-CoA dehydrogenase family protein [Pontibaca salina]